MTTYNTINPVPSSDARDRYDNSQVFDELMNGPAPSTPDRLGVLRQSWAGMEAAFAGSETDRAEAFQTFLANSGWSSLGAYGAGIQIISHTQTVDYQGQPYQLKSTVPASLDAPYVTTGNWAVEGVNFKLVGDNSLRQDLAEDSGAGLLGFDKDAEVPAGTVGATLKNLPTLNPTLAYDWNGTSGTDDRAAIQQQIDSTSAGPLTLGRGAIAFRSGGSSVLGGTVQVLKKNLNFLGNQVLFKWQGAAAQPIFRVVDSSRCKFSDMIILGNLSAPPIAAFYFEAETPLATLGTNENHLIERVIIGRRWGADTTTGGSTDATPAGKVVNGIVVGGALDGNNDEYTIRETQIHSCSDAGIDFKNSQGIWSLISGVLLNDCNVGIRLGCNMNAQHLTFNRNRVADMEGVRNTETWITGFEAEHSKIAIWSKGSSSFYVRGGKILIQQGVPGNFTRTEQGGSLTLSDMTLVSNGAGAQSFYYRDGRTKPGLFQIKNCVITAGSSRDTYDLDTGGLDSLQHTIDVEHGDFVFKTRSPYIDRSVTPGAAIPGGSTTVATGAAKANLSSFFNVAYQFALGAQHLTVAIEAATQIRARISNVSGSTLQLAAGRMRWMDLGDHVAAFASLATSGQVLASGAGQTFKVPVPGAQLGDFTAYTVNVSYLSPTITSYVSAPDEVSLRVQNLSGGAAGLPAAVLTAAVIRPAGNYMGGLIEPSPVVFASGTSTSRKIPVPGAQLGGHTFVSFSKDILGLTISAHVSGPGEVTAVISNFTGASVTLPAGSFKTMVMF